MEYVPVQMPMQYAPSPPPKKSHAALLVILLIVVVAGGASVAYFLSKKASASTCAGVILWSGPGVGLGSSFCAKPGAAPSDLPFVPQAFFIPAGSTAGFSFTGTTSANNNTGTVTLNLTGNAKSASSIAPNLTIIKTNSFSVTASQ